MRSPLLLPSGGLRYHARALRHRHAWAPFRARLARFLTEDWNPPRDRPLVLIGCSAGWCLPLDVIADLGVAGIVACDIDPLGLAILSRRLRARLPCSTSLVTRVGDALGVTHDGRPHVPGAALRSVLEAHAGAHVLFCNVWGQLIFDAPDDVARAAWKSALPGLLAGRSWASFFDRVSGKLPPRIEPENERSDRSLSDDELLARFYAPHAEARSVASLVDHGTEDVVVDLPRLHLSWELVPGTHHLIEAIAVADDGAADKSMARDRS
jgi:hypothetical protein